MSLESSSLAHLRKRKATISLRPLMNSERFQHRIDRVGTHALFPQAGRGTLDQSACNDTGNLRCHDEEVRSSPGTKYGQPDGGTGSLLLASHRLTVEAPPSLGRRLIILLIMRTRLRLCVPVPSVYCISILGYDSGRIL